MTWLHFTTCVFVYSYVLLISLATWYLVFFWRNLSVGHQSGLPGLVSQSTVHSSLLYRNMLSTYASSVLILILRVVLLSYSICLSLLYAAFASCFFCWCLLLCSRGFLDIFIFSSVLFHFFLYNIVLAFLCCCADCTSLSLLWYLPPVRWCFVSCLLPSQCRMHIVDLLVWSLCFCCSCVLLHVNVYGLLQCCMNLVGCSCDLLCSFWFLVLQPDIGWIGLGSNSHLVVLIWLITVADYLY